MFVGVKYLKDGNVYAGRDYTYSTALDLKVGDKIIAPTAKGESKAIVTALNLDEPKFACKEITKFDEPF